MHTSSPGQDRLLEAWTFDHLSMVVIIAETHDMPAKGTLYITLHMYLGPWDPANL